jgi:hypothetical protein
VRNFTFDAPVDGTLLQHLIYCSYEWKEWGGGG